MIKLAILIDVLKNTEGGAERQVYEFAKRIDKEKFSVYLFVLHQQNIPDEVKQIGIKAMALSIKRSYGLRGILAGFKLRRFLKQKGIDILMTYHFASDIWGTIFGKLAGVPVIVSNRRDAGFWRKKPHIWAYRFVNRWVDKIIVVSQAVGQMVIKEEAVSEEKIELIYNGVEINKFNSWLMAHGLQLKVSLGIENNEVVVGMVANFSWVKGYEYFIDAAKLVLEKVPKTKIILVGDGPERKRSAYSVERSGLEKKVLFLGTRKDISELLQIMNICVLSSISEGLSNTLLEYMAAGKPVIATAVGGNIEVIENEKNGILVPAKDALALSKQIIRLLANKELAQKLAIEAKKTVSEKFNLNRQIKTLESSLENTVKKEIRVMHLISSNGVFGAEKVMLNLAANMNYNGIKSRIVVIKNLHNPHLEVFEEALRRNIPAGFVESRGRLDMKAIRQIAKIIKANKINLIHTHNYKANFLGVFAARKAGIPVIATNHLWTSSGFKLRLYEKLDAFMLNFFVRKIIAVSKEIKEDMLKSGIRSSKIKVILNGIGLQIEPNDKRAVKNDFDIGEDVLVIGVAARLSPEKGHRFLLEAAQEVIKTYPQLVFLIIGDGPLKNELIEKTKHLGISEKVIFAGYQTNMQKIYPIIDILVQPSLREGIPLTILEAMTHAKAIVATDVGGVADLIKDRDTGLLIKAGSSEELCEAISAFVDDVSLRKAVGEKAQEFVRENYSLEKMVDAHRKVYEEVLWKN